MARSLVLALLTSINLGFGATRCVAAGDGARTGPAGDATARVNLVRRYRIGESTRYQTETHTTATVRISPPGLEALLPPLPTQVSTRQQNTLTVRAIHANGVADVENRFDRLDLQYDLPQQTPQEIRDSSLKEQQAFCRRAIGQRVVAHYDRGGRLLGFEGAEAILDPLSAPLRQPFEQVLKFLLQQMGGSPFYPNHPVELNGEWKRSFRVNSADASSWTLEGESTYRYEGQAEYRGSKAAVIRFSFTRLLTPGAAALPGAVPKPSQAETTVNGLQVQVKGRGQGRMLAALESGAILENQASVHQTLEISVRAMPGVNRPPSDPITVQMEAETTFQMQGMVENQIESTGRMRQGGASDEAPTRP